MVGTGTFHHLLRCHPVPAKLLTQRQVPSAESRIGKLLSLGWIELMVYILQVSGKRMNSEKKTTYIQTINLLCVFWHLQLNDSLEMLYDVWNGMNISSCIQYFRHSFVYRVYFLCTCSILQSWDSCFLVDSAEIRSDCHIKLRGSEHLWRATELSFNAMEASQVIPMTGAKSVHVVSTAKLGKGWFFFGSFDSCQHLLGKKEKSTTFVSPSPI